MIVFKKVRLLNDGKCYPLFIDKKKPFLFGEWMRCEFHPTNGFAPRSIGNGVEGGWHATKRPIAPHLADRLKNGEQRVWLECEAKGQVTEYERSEFYGGNWYLCEYIKPLRILSSLEVDNIRKLMLDTKKEVC